MIGDQCLHGLGIDLWGGSSEFDGDFREEALRQLRDVVRALPQRGQRQTDYM